MGAKHILDETFKVITVAGIGRFLAVKPTTVEGECDISGSAAEKVLGITQEAQATQYENVAVRTMGVSRFVAGAGGALVGSLLVVDGSTGKLVIADLTASGNPYILAVSRSVVLVNEVGTCLLIHSVTAKSA